MKVIKLTESDLIRIVNRVVNESSPITKDKTSIYMRLINDIGYYKVAKLMGGASNLKGMLRTETPRGYLSKYDDLKEVPVTKLTTHYLDKNGRTIMTHYKPRKDENGKWIEPEKDEWSPREFVGIDLNIIFTLQENFNLVDLNDAKKIIADWLVNVFNITVPYYEVKGIKNIGLT
jgi:hypothetical protein